MDKTFKEKVVVITGAGSGIGRAASLAFARLGAKVVAADISDTGGKQTVDAITIAGGEALFVQTDVSKADQVERLMNETMAAFGRLDCAFNNAGIEGEFAATADCTEENWDSILSTNLKGVWLCMKYQIPHMLKTGGGAIVNMGSVASLVGFQNLPAYCASKGGVLQLTRAAALEYVQQGIRINAICPGSIGTPMVERVAKGDRQAMDALATMAPINRIGTPDEIADAVTWLCSSAASFVVGHAMMADGGYVAR